MTAGFALDAVRPASQIVHFLVLTGIDAWQA
jgi:hypothetical protein